MAVVLQDAVASTLHTAAASHLLLQTGKDATSARLLELLVPLQQHCPASPPPSSYTTPRTRLHCLLFKSPWNGAAADGLDPQRSLGTWPSLTSASLAPWLPELGPWWWGELWPAARDHCLSCSPRPAVPWATAGSPTAEQEGCSDACFPGSRALCLGLPPLHAQSP